MAFNPNGFNNPFQVVDSRVPYGMGKQYGTSVSSYMGSGNGYLANGGRPDHMRLGEFERAWLTDETVAAGLEFIKLSIMASVREYVHPEPQIQAFVQDALKRMSGNWRLSMAELVMSALWAGFGVSEINYAANEGRIWLSSLANYNPRSIQFHVNMRGELTEGEPSLLNSAFSTGIWQDNFYGMPQRIPLRKAVVVTHGRMYGNFYGESLIRRIYKNWRLKEVVLELWNIALDRHGTPIIYMVVPPGDTGRSVPDVTAPGGMREESIQDAAVTSLSNIHVGSSVVVTRPTPDDKIEIGTLTTGNNFGDSFVNAVKYYNRAIWRGFLIPQLLLQENDQASLGTGNAAATQFHVFKLLLQQLTQEVVEPFTEQIIGPLIRVNFENYDPGEFVLNPTDPASAETLIALYEAAQNLGASNSRIARDINKFRANAGMDTLAGKELDEVLRANDARFNAELKQMMAQDAAAKAKGREVLVKRVDVDNRGAAAQGQLEIQQRQLQLNAQQLEIKRVEAKNKLRVDAARKQGLSNQDLIDAEAAADRLMNNQ